MRGFFILSILLGFPALEIFATFRVAQIIGWWLLPWLIASAVVGGWLIREAGVMVPVKLFAALNAGHNLNLALLDSFRTVFAGLLLIFPGVASDFLALLLLLLPHPKMSPQAASRDDG
ncbi:MAG: FxsA family protein, partial [Gammaproteobacteria bacterium]|nr:FxsA family protein [Gammaproteobacteria bacterium]